MNDYISRAVVLDEAEKVSLMERNYRTYGNVVRSIPAADVVEVRHGKWVDTEPNLPDWSPRKTGMAYYCSVCGHSAGKNKHNTYRWCPWCGAKMDGGLENRSEPPCGIHTVTHWMPLPPLPEPPKEEA